MSGSAEMNKAMSQMQQQMASMPPEQRKVMEDMLAKQGVKMGTGGPGGMSVKICMTREMIERNDMPTQDGNCKTTSQQRNGNTIKMAYTCTNPPSTGEGQYTIVSPEAYTTKVTMHTTAKGKPETMNMSGSGKWLGTDCGTIKPMRAPGAK